RRRVRREAVPAGVAGGRAAGPPGGGPPVSFRRPPPPGAPPVPGGGGGAPALPILGVATILMLIAAHPTSGTSLYGASRWIDLGPLTVQPSELAKLALVAATATILAKKWGRLGGLGHLLIPLAP